MIAGVGNRSYNRVTFGAGHTDGKPATLTLFTVTGLVEMRIFAHVETALAGASATLAVGTSTTAGGLIAQATGTDMVAGDIWWDGAPDASVEVSSQVAAKLVTQDIKLTIASGTLTAGRIMFTVIWKPISDDASVVANIGTLTEGGGSASASASPSASSSPSASVSPSASTSISPSASRSPSSSVSPSSSASSSQSPSASRSPSASSSPSSSVSPSMDI